MTPDRFRFADIRVHPLRALWWRLVMALSLILFVALVAYLDRDGYVDNGSNDGVNALDAVYYATVSVTTTGYGDIIPVSDSAKFLTTVIVTPARVLFLILLVGTTLEVLASHSRFLMRLRKWQKNTTDHIILCGYGVKGRAALEYLRGVGENGEVIVIDPSPSSVEACNAAGITGIVGSASDEEILKNADIEKAKIVLVAPDQDDTAVLITLRARELNPRVTIVVACREEANAELIENSGADSVIVSAGSAGRLMGMAAVQPAAAQVVTDLLSSGHGLEIEERPVAPQEEGLRVEREETFLAVQRDGHLLRFSEGEAGDLQPGDRVILVREEK